MSRIHWTNPSVLRFADGADPIDAMVERAGAVVAKALDSGWSGPPFDPWSLAELLGIRVTPSADVLDARTVPARNGFRIEFNPNRPSGRRRYSITHEIAHSFFADCGEEVRNRGWHDGDAADNWQLEALCNVGAAELLMPAGSLPAFGSDPLSIDRLLELRERYDVSVEAMLIRASHATERPCAAFCAHRVESGKGNGKYQLDYSIPSRAWRSPPTKGLLLSPDSVVSGCTAIGYTAKGVEELKTGEKVTLECVGVPPYPGLASPRVVGIMTPTSEITLEPVASLTTLRGSALEPQGQGPHVVVQVVNNRTSNWGGGGFAAQVRKKWPAAQDAFKEWAQERKLSDTLGEVCFATVEPAVIVASMIAQVGYGPSKTPRIRYAALKRTLAEVAHLASQRGATVHMPRIGAGQAGGSWPIIQDLIQSSIVAGGTPVRIYDLPGSTPPSEPQLTLGFQEPV